MGCTIEQRQQKLSVSTTTRITETAKAKAATKGSSPATNTIAGIKTTAGISIIILKNMKRKVEPITNIQNHLEANLLALHADQIYSSSIPTLNSIYRFESQKILEYKKCKHAFIFIMISGVEITFSA